MHLRTAISVWRISLLTILFPAISLHGQSSRSPGQPGSFTYCPGGGQPCIQIPYTAVPSGGTGGSGPQGPAGLDGYTPQPRVGAGVPSSGLGSDKDIYLNSLTGDFYVKASGSWGSPLANLKGAAGAAGTNGSAGAAGAAGAAGYTPQPRTGAGAPSSGLGNYTDLYMDSTNGDFYIKASGAWGSPVLNLKGPAGDPATVPIASSTTRGTVAPSSSDFDVNSSTGGLTIKASAKATIGASLATAGAVGYDPGCQKFYLLSAGTDCVSSGPSLTTGVSPSTLSITRGASSTVTGSETVTFTTANLSGGITPTASIGGSPAGISIAFATSPVASTGGTSVATITVTSIAPAGTYTITWGGTSGGTTATTATSTLTIILPANFLTSSQSVISSPYAIPTTDLDWRDYGNSPGYHKNATSLVTDMNCAAGYVANDGGYAQSISWSDASGTASGSSTFGAYWGGGCTAPYVTSQITDSAAHDYNVIFYAGGGVANSARCTVTANISDASSADKSEILLSNGDNQLFKVQYHVRSSGGGTKQLKISALQENGVNCLLQAVEVLN